MIGYAWETIDWEISAQICDWIDQPNFDECQDASEVHCDYQWRVMDTAENIDRRSQWCPWGNVSDHL